MKIVFNGKTYLEIIQEALASPYLVSQDEEGDVVTFAFDFHSQKQYVSVPKDIYECYVKLTNKGS